MRFALDLVFGLLLLGGVGAGAVFLMVLRNLIEPQGEGAFGIYLYGMSSLFPTVLAWAGGGVLTMLGSPHREVRLAAAVTTAHLLWWAIAIGLLMSVDFRSTTIITIALLEPGPFALAAILLALRWFRMRRGRMAGHP